jgi:hypothetical protein
LQNILSLLVGVVPVSQPLLTGVPVVAVRVVTVVPLPVSLLAVVQALKTLFF